MTRNKFGSPLSVVARTWANEINQEYELVASILFRYSRGDYHGDTDPYLALFLSPTNDPAPIPEITIDKVDIDQGDTTISIEFADGPNTKEDYIFADIDQLLVENEPNINYSSLVDFCSSQNVPIPGFIKNGIEIEENPDDSVQLSRNEIRKLETKKRYSEWHQVYERLQNEHPDKSDVWISEKIKRTDIGKNHSPKTIRKNMK